MIEVSVIVPLYNSQEFIATCLTSILNQSHADLEVIVVNDCSSDKSLDRIASFRHDGRVRLLQTTQNLGASAARNLGIEAAKGRYIAFCDSDDLWEVTKIELQLAAMRAIGAPVAHSSVYYVKSGVKVLIPAKQAVTYEDMKVRNWIANSSGIYDSAILGKIFQSPYRHEDYEMWCDALRPGGQSIGLVKSLATINRCGNSLSGNKVHSVLWHIQAQKRIFAMSDTEVMLRMAQNVLSRLRARVPERP